MKHVVTIILAVMLSVSQAQDPGQNPAQVAAARAERDRKCAAIRAQIAAVEKEMSRPITAEDRAAGLTRQKLINECNDRIAVLKAELWKVSTTK